MPPTNRRSSFHDIRRGPHDAQVIHFGGHFVVRADDVEVTHDEVPDEVVDCFFRRPGSIWLNWGVGESGVGPSGTR
jgi:hypothetical protein